MKTQAVQNFLSSLDMQMKIVEHFANCMMDAQLYKWDSETVIAIMSGIEDRYKDKVKAQGGE